MLKDRQHIVVTGAGANNLKGVDLRIPLGGGLPELPRVGDGDEGPGGVEVHAEPRGYNRWL